jgi:MoaA/NifB/PqqE/SkfB family radical SAM enzyme
MSLEIYRAALQYIRDTDDVISIGGGEPTLHPDFLTMLMEAIAVSPESPPWLATNGSQTKTALMLAGLAKRGIIGCALSRDAYHDEIDDKVLKAFTCERRLSGSERDYPDGREIRDTSGHLIKAGRCKDGSDGCMCPDLFVDPDGNVRGCGCKRAPVFGNVVSGFTIPDEWSIRECYQHQAVTLDI